MSRPAITVLATKIKVTNPDMTPSLTPSDSCSCPSESELAKAKGVDNKKSRIKRITFFVGIGIILCNLPLGARLLQSNQALFMPGLH